MAHRLRLVETKEVQSPEEVQAAREALQRAEEALREALTMIGDLKALVVKLSPPATSGYSPDDVSFVGSDYSN